ncbi:hypothetical protein niasHT_019432 [Heterodera trifolii]|uniref:RING-type domain-containing protein n=1 Tax=Heterodera trifolii TaxID=157864 RepID=A0ABD2KVZ6_9BILA
MASLSLRFSADQQLINDNELADAADCDEQHQQQLQSDEFHLLGLSEHISCPLCGDFLSDAVTLIGCLHFFCRPCLLRHLSSQNSPNCCPKCYVQLGPEKPFFRPDSALQELVYKLVPDLFWRRLSRIARSRRRPPPSSANASALSAERRLLKRQRLLQLSASLCSPDEKISVQIDYVPLAHILAANRSHHHQTTANAGTATPSGTVPSASISVSASPGGVVPSPAKVKRQQQPLFFRRFFRCSARVRVEQLKQLLEMKLAMTDPFGVYFVDGTLQNVLEDDYTLEDIVHLFNWSRESPLLLRFTLAKLSQEEEEDKPPVLEEMPQLEVEGETAPTAAQIIHRTEKIDDGKVSTEDDDGGEIVMDTDGGGGEIVAKNNNSRGKKDGERQQQTQGERQEKQTNSAPKKTVPAEVQQPNAQSAEAAVSPPQLHSFGIPSAAEVPSLKNERKKHSRKSNVNKMEENEMNLATKAGEETTAPMPKKRKAPQKGGDKETTKRKKIVGETKGGESSRTSDKAEGRETEGEKQEQEKEGGNELKERGTESREKRDSFEKSDGDQNQLTERENADQLNTETTKQQQKEKESVAKGENKEGRDSETENADEKLKETQKKASTSSDQISGQNLLLNEIGTTTTEGQQKEEQMPTMKLTEKKQQKTIKSKAKTETMAEKANEKSNGKSGHSKSKTYQKKTSPTAYSSMASAQAQHQYQSNNNTNINQQQQQQFQLGQLQQHLSSVVVPPAMGGGVPSPFGPSQIPFAPQMAAAYAPFLQNFMQNGGAATTSAYTDTFSAMVALLQQQRQPPTPQQQHQLGQMFAGRMMGMASAAAANANASGRKVPTTTQHQKAPATAKVMATNGTGGRGMPSMANGGSTTTKANSGNNGTKSSKSGGGGGGTKSPVKALPTMGRGEDRPSMVGKAPTSGGKSGGGGHPMTNGTTAEQMKQQQQKSLNGQSNRFASSSSVLLKTPILPG